MCRYLFFFASIALPTCSYAQLTNQPEQNCINAIELTHLIYVQNISYSGNGGFQDIDPNLSCMDNGENSSVWYTFVVSRGGMLGFTLTPQSGDDYDFALYDITGRICADITNGTAPEVRCNFAFTNGPTGLRPGYTSTTSGPGGDIFNAPLPKIQPA